MSDDIASDRQPVHISTAIEPVLTQIQKNLQAAQRRKEAKERDDRERAERKRQKILIQEQQKIRAEISGNRVVIAPPERLVARHATEMPFPCAMIRIRLSAAIEMKWITIDGRTWRVTTRYDELVARLNAAPKEVQVHLFKSATAPGTPPDPVVVPTGIFVKASTPEISHPK
jgi:hypothetical protein